MKKFESIFKKSKVAIVQIAFLVGRGNRKKKRGADKAQVQKSDLIVIVASCIDLYRNNETEKATRFLNWEVLRWWTMLF